MSVSTSVSGSYLDGYYLTSVSQLQFTLGRGGYIAGSGPNGALYATGTAGIGWSITNYGVVNGTGVNGIQLGSVATNVDAGYVTNQTGGTVSGGVYGVAIFNDDLATVLNNAGGTISGTNVAAGGGVYLLGAGTVTNYGVITAPTVQFGIFGIRVVGGAEVVNYGSGTIQSFTGVFADQSGTVINAGTVSGIGGDGVQFGVAGTSVGGATVLNQASGSIAGSVYGVSVYNSAASHVVNYANATISGTGGGVKLAGFGTVLNGGVITAASGTTMVSGLYLPNGGTVINYAGATIEGNRGVNLGHGGSLSQLSAVADYGAIIAAAGDYAVYFAPGDPGSRLIVGASAAFTGSIAGGGGVVELASAGSPASLYGFGITISNFSTLAFDSANWTAGGDAAALQTMAITGFITGDTLKVDDFAATSASFTSAGTLTLTDSVHSTSMVLTVNGTASTPVFILTSGGVTDITECFAAGTRIATLEGEIPIEDLAIGGLVLARFAGIAPIQWIGRRQVDCSRHPDPRTVWPVRVSADAFGPGRPSRDLRLSPNHAVYLCGELIPVRHLINGTSIEQMPVDEIIYYHLELAQHDLVTAEGQPAETYLDVGDRRNFVNDGGVTRLYPDFGSRPPDIASEWEMRGCAPLLLRGPRLDTVRHWVSGLAVGEGLVLAA